LQNLGLADWPVWRSATGRFGSIPAEQSKRYHSLPMAALLFFTGRQNSINSSFPDFQLSGNLGFCHTASGKAYDFLP
jgi:hypothetical protein